MSAHSTQRSPMDNAFRVLEFALRPALAVGLTALAACLLLGALAPALELFHYGWWGGRLGLALAGFILIAAGGVLACGAWLSRRREPLPVAPFLATAVLLSVLVKFALIATVAPAWGGDYLRYWNTAIGMVEDGTLSAGTSLFRQRVIPAFYPIVYLFGDSPLALKVVNATALVAVLLLGYDILRRVRNHQAAQAFAFVFALCPIPTFEILIPSHNLWGLFFLSLVVWSIAMACVAKARRPLLTTIAYATLAAVMLNVLEMQRGGTGLLTLAVVASAALLAWPQWKAVGAPAYASNARPILVAVVLLLLAAPLSWLGESAGMQVKRTPAVQTMMMMKYAAHGGVFGDGRSSSWARFDQRFNDKHKRGPEEASDFARSIILSSWADEDGSKPRLVRALLPRIFNLGYPPDWNVTLKQPADFSPAVRNALAAYANAFGLLCALAAAAGLIMTWLSGRRPPLPILSVLAFMGLLAAGLLVMFENKPPNLYPTWLALPLFLAWAASSSTEAAEITRRQALLQGAVGWVAAVAVLWIVLMSLDKGYGTNHGRVIDDWHVDFSRTSRRALAVDQVPRAFDAKYYPSGSIKSFVRRDAAEDSARLGKYAQNFFTAIELPLPIRRNDVATLSKRICPDGARDSLEFFVFASYQRRDRPNSFVVEVAVDNRIVKRIAIPIKDRNMRLVQIPDAFAAPGCHTLQVSLRSRIKSDRRSWQEASHVEIWVPRLIEADQRTDEPAPRPSTARTRE